jgi:hypothetical protein
MSANPYRDPRAMRNAIADRLRPLARERGVELSSLQRQFAYDRLCCPYVGRASFEPGQHQSVTSGGSCPCSRV